ncbi:MAG: PIG-L family deacetylase [Pseudomonadota bacterium]|nr:PIG-L family deacetylase [Pseudomonadota bacterium]
MSVEPSNVSHLTDPRAFDTTETGTSELQWVEFLRGAPPLELDARAVVVVSPHPDDETLGAGGLIRAAVLRGLPVTILSVTDGEQARPTQTNLSSRRRAELQRALTHLGTPASPIRILRAAIPDGAVAGHEKELRDALRSVVSAGDLVIGPFERDGHCDHEATARSCLSIARQVGARCIRYPIWAWHQASPASLAGRSWVRFELDAGLRRCKARAVDCFRSQLESHPDGPIVPAHVRQYFSRSFEAFVV